MIRPILKLRVNHWCNYAISNQNHTWIKEMFVQFADKNNGYFHVGEALDAKDYHAVDTWLKCVI